MPIHPGNLWLPQRQVDLDSGLALDLHAVSVEDWEAGFQFAPDGVDDCAEIQAADPYSDDYDATVARNSREQDTDARPEIAGALPDVSSYDVVLLGCGIWNVRPPMIMSTFVESVDLTGVRVHPFVTYAVSGPGRTESVYADAVPGLILGESLAVRGEEQRNRAMPWSRGCAGLG